MSAADGFRPGALWNLWDMLKFSAANFYKLTTSAHAAKAYIDASNAALSQITSIVPQFNNNKFTDSCFSDPKALNLLLDQSQYLREAAVELGANITAMAIDEYRNTLQKDNSILFGKLSSNYSDIFKTLERELSTTHLFSLNADEYKYFEPSDPLFGQDFEAKFGTLGAFELDEAAKCMALGRPTAAVFHMMRILEVGIKALAKCLGIPDPIKPSERNWEKILERIMKDGIEKKWPNAANRMSGDGEFFEDLYATLDAVKNPWRNSTMHVEEKKTDQEAEHIFVAVRGFMMRLSSRMDEDGFPLA
jgi:hypothetical protein